MKPIMGLSGYKNLKTDADRIAWLKAADRINAVNMFLISLTLLLVMIVFIYK